MSASRPSPSFRSTPGRATAFPLLLRCSKVAQEPPLPRADVEPGDLRPTPGCLPLDFANDPLDVACADAVVKVDASQSGDHVWRGMDRQDLAGLDDTLLGPNKLANLLDE